MRPVAFREATLGDDDQRHFPTTDRFDTNLAVLQVVTVLGLGNDEIVEVSV